MENLSNMPIAGTGNAESIKKDKQDGALVLDEGWFKVILGDYKKSPSRIISLVERNFGVSIPLESQESLVIEIERDDDKYYQIYKTDKGRLVIEPLKTYQAEDDVPTDEELREKYNM